MQNIPVEHALTGLNHFIPIHRNVKQIITDKFGISNAGHDEVAFCHGHDEFAASRTCGDDSEIREWWWCILWVWQQEPGEGALLLPSKVVLVQGLAQQNPAGPACAVEVLALQCAWMLWMDCALLLCLDWWPGLEQAHDPWWWRHGQHPRCWPWEWHSRAEQWHATAKL